MNKIKITILAENNVSQTGLLAEHGLSFLIKYQGKTMLFDTGQGFVLEHNATKLGYNLSNIDYIILSHGHYDHSGSLKKIASSMTKGDIYLHPDAIQEKYIKKIKGSMKDISAPWFDQEYLQKKEIQIHWTKKSTQIIKDMYVTGEIPRKNNFEDVGNNFFKDKKASKKDEIKDDQAVFFETEKGVVVLLGCAHSGIINTLQYICEIAKSKHIHAVIGGMHLRDASQTRLENSISALNKLNIDLIAPGHCTGFKAKAYIYNHFKGTFKDLEVGSSFTFIN